MKTDTKADGTDGDSRNKSAHPQPSGSQQRHQKYTLEEEQPTQEMVLGKLEIQMQWVKLDSYLLPIRNDIRDLDLSKTQNS